MTTPRLLSKNAEYPRTFLKIKRTRRRHPRNLPTLITDATFMGLFGKSVRATRTPEPVVYDAQTL